MSAIAGLAYGIAGHHARVFVAFHPANIRTGLLVRFLKHLLRHVRGRIVVIWDNLSAHRSPAVRDLTACNPRLQLAYLPPYAPELNPVEGLWAWLKGTCLANVCEDGLDRIVKRARKGVRRARARPSLLAGFLKKSTLPL